MPSFSYIFLRKHLISEQMEGIVDNSPVPAVEKVEIACDATMSSDPPASTATDDSGGVDGSATSYPWSLTHEQQVSNLKKNWKRASTASLDMGVFLDEFDTNPWFSGVVGQLRVDSCLDSKKLKIDVHGEPKGRMESLDLAILMGDLKMVQDILQRGSFSDEVVCGNDCREGYYTPLHLAVASGEYLIVDELLKKGADVNSTLRRCGSPLDLACTLEDMTMLQQLVAKDVHWKDPLHVAVQFGNIDFIKKLPSLNVNVQDRRGRTPLHYLPLRPSRDFQVARVIEYLDAEAREKDETLDVRVLDDRGLSAFYLAVICCDTELVTAFVESFEKKIELNFVCNKELGPPIQIAFERGEKFKEIQNVLMECDRVKLYIEKMYNDRQVFMDAANAILVGGALIAGITFASWLQPPLNYTSYSGEGYASLTPTSTASNLNYVDVEHNMALRAFWVFNALAFYFAIGTVVYSIQSVLPKNYIFIKRVMEKLRTNVHVAAMFLMCSAYCVIIAFAIAGTIVLTPQLKYQWYMIVPTIVGGIGCILSLFSLVRSMMEGRVEAYDLVHAYEKFIHSEDLGYLR